MAVVVIDTNSIGGGSYRSSQLRHLTARLSARGHELAIPEVVIWEWAEHTRQRLREAVPGVARVRKIGLPSTVIPEIVVPDLETILAEIHSDIAAMPGARSLSADASGALDAIRQQVLQVGMGERRNGTKTGAADAVIAHSVASLYETDPDRLVALLSGDEALGDECLARATGNFFVFPAQKQLLAWLGTTTPANTEIATAIRDHVAASLISWVEDANEYLDTDFPLFGGGTRGEDQLRKDAGWRRRDLYRLDIAVDAIDSVTLSDIEVLDDDDVPRLVFAEVQAVVDATLAIWSFDNDGSLKDDYDAARLRVLAPITVEFDANWRVRGFECSAAAELEPAQE